MSFRDIRGQLQAMSVLQSALRQNRLAKAYLFAGEEGVGKALVARTIAKAINCLQGDGADSCDHCISCRKIDNFNHPDVHWIMPEGASNSIKIETIRELKESIYLKPFEAKKKIFIIDHAENFTPEAANAFLKVLEEPPGEGLLILLAAKPKLIFPTVLSRCQKLFFGSLKKQTLQEVLREEFGVDHVLGHYLAYCYGGRIGMALSLKESDILSEKNKVIDDWLFSSRDYSDREVNRENLHQDLDVLATWFRDIIFAKLGMPHTELINLDRRDDLLEVMDRYSFLDLDGIMSFIAVSGLYLQENVNPKLLASNLRIRLWRG